MSLLDDKFKYTSAEDSRKPNYLRNKFNAVRKTLRDAAEAQKKVEQEAARVVTTIKRART